MSNRKIQTNAVKTHPGMSDESSIPENMTRTELGLAVAVRSVDEWRMHTAKNWKSSDPESYALCIEMIQEHGITNISEIQRELEKLGVEKSRQTIAALMRQEFTVEQLAGMAAKNAQIAVLQGTSKMVEVIPDAKKSDLMAVSMSTKMAHDIERSLNGLPSEIKAVVTVSAQDRLEEARKRAAALLAQKSETVVEAEVVEPSRGDFEMGRLGEIEMEELKTENGGSEK